MVRCCPGCAIGRPCHRAQPCGSQPEALARSQPRGRRHHHGAGLVRDSVQRFTRLLPLCAPRTATFGGQVGSRIGHLRQVVGRERRVAVQRHRVDQVPADVDTLYLPLPYRRVGADQPPASGAVAVPQPAKRQVQAIGGSRIQAEQAQVGARHHRSGSAARRQQDLEAYQVVELGIARYGPYRHCEPDTASSVVLPLHAGPAQFSEAGQAAGVTCLQLREVLLWLPVADLQIRVLKAYDTKNRPRQRLLNDQYNSPKPGSLASALTSRCPAQAGAFSRQSVPLFAARSGLGTSGAESPLRPSAHARRVPQSRSACDAQPFSIARSEGGGRFLPSGSPAYPTLPPALRAQGDG